VRECGRFWVCEVRERLERFGRGRMRREARIRTWRSENFFSSSRVRLEGSAGVLVEERREEEGTVAGLCGSREGGARGRR